MFMAGLGVWFQSVTLPAGHISDFWVAQETKNVQQTSLKMNFLQNMYHSEQQPEIHQFSLAFPIFSALSPFHLVSAQSGRTTSLGQH
jgi:hypothetical protein